MRKVIWRVSVFFRQLSLKPTYKDKELGKCGRQRHHVLSNDIG